MKVAALAGMKLDHALRCVGCGVCCVGVFVFGIVLLFTWLDRFVLIWRVDYHESASVIAYGTWYPAIQGRFEVESEVDGAELDGFMRSDRHVQVFQREGAMQFPATAFGLHLAWVFAGFATPLLFLAGRRAVRWRRSRRRAQRGQCASCGYDLTRNESGSCPECGVTIAVG